MIERILQQVALFARRRYRLVFAVALVLTVVCVGLFSRLRFDTEVLNLLPQDDPIQRRPDIALAKERLGWTPRIDLETGLKATIKHFQEIEKSDFRPPTPNIILNTRRSPVDA